jgi:DNA-binding winged helix-turn-helix (wHTH) protein
MTVSFLPRWTMNAYGVGLGVSHPKFDGEARSARIPQKALRMRFERFELDEDNARLLCDGKPVDLPPRPFEVLCVLARRPGTLVTKNALLDEVWGHRFVSESVLKTVIGKLRTALQDDARNPRFIESVPRRGYRFIAAGSVNSADSAARPYLAHRQPQASPTPLDVAGITAERALCEIREMLCHLIELSQGGHGAAVRLMDCVTQWTAKTPSKSR